jgi:uncharacterized surface protein with fasciclin (FAS1) repeats
MITHIARPTVVFPPRAFRAVRTIAIATTLMTAWAASPRTLTAQHTNQGNPSSSATRSGSSIPVVAKTAGQFTTLLAAVEAAGLTQTLLGRGPLTVFAPTDEAFKRLPSGTVEELLKPENRERLRTLLTYHVVAGRVTAAQARTVRTAETVANLPIRVSEADGLLRINDATVRIADVPASNGLIHVIDRVLMPPDARRASAGDMNSSAAVALVDYAIDRGAPLFNDGQPAATIAIYEVAITALVSWPTAGLSDESQRALRNALRADRGGSARDRAFALRRALDDARRQLDGRMEVSRR